MSDELHFTGADLNRRSRRRKEYEYSESSGSSDNDDEDGSDDRAGGTMQVALRDKEELLVQKALERIRRAQELGKTNVKLSRPEVDALERKRQTDAGIRTQSRPDLRTSDRRRSSGQSSSTSKNPQSHKNNKGKRHLDDESSSSSRRATPPGILVAGPSGIPSYQPFGYYPAPTAAAPKGRTSGSGSRSTSTHNPDQISPPLPRSQNQRYFSGPSLPSSRSLPDDPNWIPRPRSSSSSMSNSPYPSDPYQYQAYSPALPQIPPQYTQSSRRIVSNPQPEPYYPRLRGEAQARSSEPSLLRREYSGQETPEESSSEESEEDEEDDGVQVDVVPYGRGGYDVRIGAEGSAARERPRRGRGKR